MMHWGRKRSSVGGWLLIAAVAAAWLLPAVAPEARLAAARPGEPGAAAGRPDAPAHTTGDSRDAGRAAAHGAARPGPSTLSVPSVGARASFAPRSADRGAGAGDADQPAVLSLVTGMAAGCVRSEQSDPPALDCSIRAGDAFVESVRAFVEAPGLPQLPYVRLVLDGQQDGMTLRRLDAAGNETGEPLNAQGEINARFRYAPTAHPTAPGQPLEVDLVAVVNDGQVDLGAKAVVRLRLHVLGARQSIVGYVFEDRDGDGQRDVGEAGIAGWPVDLKDSQGRPRAATPDGNGRFQFDVDTTDLYHLAQTPPGGWVPTRPTSVDLKVDLAQGPAADVLFGYRRVETRPDVSATLQTDRGCREGGGDPRYTIGEAMRVQFGVSGLPEADVSLTLNAPGRPAQVLVDRQRIPGGQPYAFDTTAGDAAGDGRLELTAYVPGQAAPAHTVGCTYGVAPAASPTVDYAPGKVDFGTAPLNGAIQRGVTLRNIGQAPLYLNTLGIQGGSASPFALYTPNVGNVAIPPGQSYTVNLQFRPTGPGSYQDYLVVRCNATNTPTVTVPLYGQTQDAAPSYTGSIQSDRGCLQDQQDPLYFVGDPVQLQFRIDGPPGPQAYAQVEDIVPGGQPRLVYNRQVPLNQPVTIGGLKISPPVGDETVRLTAQVGSYIMRDECSFRVAAGGTRVVGYKFQDDNGNGIWDGCPLTPWNPGTEPPIPGWGITLTGPQSYTAATDGNGRFEFVVSAPGTYYITEEARTGWYATRPATQSVTIGCYPGESLNPILFGNKQTGCGACPPPGGPTPTAWLPPTPALPTATPWLPPTPGTPGTPPPTIPAPPTATIPPPPPPPVCGVQISPRPSQANVAELAQFTANVTGGGQQLSYQWAVSGEIIRDYRESTRQQWSVIPMQAGDFQARTLGFYWKPEPNQRHPNNAGPQPRTVSVTVTTPNGTCTDTLTLNVERNNTNINRQAEDYYNGNHSQAVLVEHTLWHATYPFQGFGYDGTLFFDFHRQYLDRFNSWRAEFGYPPVGIWDSGTSIPRGVDIDHLARGATYTPLMKPSWFTIGGGTPTRGNNGLPCDSQSGQRRLRDFPSNRTLLGCAVTHTWHNGVHTGVGGDMLNPQWSPRDPLFWRWHNFVDIISQERMSVFFAAANFARGAGTFAPAAPHGPEQFGQHYPPHATYQVPFRLFRFMDAPLERYTVVFDQSVTGVKAGDLTVNGVAATAVTGSREGPYVFTGFAAPPLGPVEVALAPGAIKNLYNEAFEGDTWRYTRVDPTLDEDRDTLTNADEVHVHLTNPLDRDSDDDGLPDGDEVKLYRTRPLMWDSDRDSANDRCELEKGSDPNDPASFAPGCPGKPIFMCWAGNGEEIDQ